MFKSGLYTLTHLFQVLYPTFVTSWAAVVSVAYLILEILLQFLICVLIKSMEVTLFSDNYTFPIHQFYQVLSTQYSLV